MASAQAFQLTSAGSKMSLHLVMTSPST
jgi:hypothetical protein